jgi:CheY-like chemotaxis protein
MSSAASRFGHDRAKLSFSPIQINASNVQRSSGPAQLPPLAARFHDILLMLDSRARKLVFVVDDEPIITETLATILKLHNYHAASAKSAEEAVALCRGVRPDAVISDVIMGEMNGIELAYHLSATIPECKVLLMSGNALTDSLLVQSPAASNDFLLLPKPVHPREILDFLAGLSS